MNQKKILHNYRTTCRLYYLLLEKGYRIISDEPWNIGWLGTNCTVETLYGEDTTIFIIIEIKEPAIDLPYALEMIQEKL